MSRLDPKLSSLLLLCNVIPRCHAIGVLGRGDRGATVPPSVTQCDSPMSDRPDSWHGQTIQSPAAPPAGGTRGRKKLLMTLTPHQTLNAPQSGL